MLRTGGTLRTHKHVPDGLFAEVAHVADDSAADSEAELRGADGAEVGHPAAATPEMIHSAVESSERRIESQVVCKSLSPSFAHSPQASSR